MPAVPPRVPGNPGTYLRNLPHGEGDPGNASTAPGVKVPQALGGWHDLNMAVARALPTSLLRAGQVQRGVLLTLRRRGRVR